MSKNNLLRYNINVPTELWEWLIEQGTEKVKEKLIEWYRQETSADFPGKTVEIAGLWDEENDTFVTIPTASVKDYWSDDGSYTSVTENDPYWSFDD